VENGARAFRKLSGTGKTSASFDIGFCFPLSSPGPWGNERVTKLPTAFDVVLGAGREVDTPLGRQRVIWVSLERRGKQGNQREKKGKKRGKRRVSQA